MTLADVVAVALLIGVAAYAVLGGADFGSGFWDLTAGRAEKGARLRALIDVSLGPVWEANHTWLIYCLVVLWTAFPVGFASIMSALFVPLSLAALGIVFRGASFAYRKATHTFLMRRVYGVVFGTSSIVTPFFLGAVAGAIANGRVPAGDTSNADPLATWLGPASLLGGALAVAACAFLSAVFLTFDAARHDDAALEEAFAKRAIGAGISCGALALIGVVVLNADAPYLFGELTTKALPLAIVSGICGIGAMVMVRRRSANAARALAVVAVASIVWAWGLAQHPYLLPEQLTIEDAAAPSATLVATLVVAAAAVVIIGPAIALLFWLAQRSLLESGDLDSIASENIKTR